MERERKIYETPQLVCIGSVQELTAATGPPINGSVVCDDFATVVDATCEIPIP